MRIYLLLAFSSFLACSSQSPGTDTRFSAVEQQLAALNTRFSAVEQQLAALNTRFSTVDKQLAAFEGHSALVEQRFAAMDKRVFTLDKQPTIHKSPFPAVDKQSTAHKASSSTPSDIQPALPPLDTATALQILQNIPSLTTAACIWKKEVRYLDATTPAIVAGKESKACIKALQEAALLTTAACIQKVDRVCWALPITPLQGVAVVEGSGIVVECGTINIDSIVSIDFNKNAAYVKYARTTTINTELTNKLKGCPLDIPESGQSSTTIVLDRNLRGEWVYLP